MGSSISFIRHLVLTLDWTVGSGKRVGDWKWGRFEDGREECDVPWPDNLVERSVVSLHGVPSGQKPRGGSQTVRTTTDSPLTPWRLSSSRSSPCGRRDGRGVSGVWSAPTELKRLRTLRRAGLPLQLSYFRFLVLSLRFWTGGQKVVQRSLN